MASSVEMVTQIVSTAFSGLDTSTLHATGLKLLGGLSLISVSWLGIQMVLEGEGFGNIISRLIRIIFLIGGAFWLLGDGFDLVFIKGVDGSLAKIADTILPGAGTLQGAVQSAMTHLMEAVGSISNSITKITENVSALDMITVIGKNLGVFVLLFLAEIILLGAMGAYLLVGTMSVFMVKIAILLGPIFIPWMVLEKTNFLFNGWLKFLIASSLYKVVGAVVLMIGGKIMDGGASVVAKTQDLAFPDNVFAALALAGLAAVIAYMTAQIPSIANGLVSGHADLGLPTFNRGGGKPSSKNDAGGPPQPGGGAVATRGQK